MELSEAIALIRNESIALPEPSIWADLGCGSGLFTHALAHYLQPGSRVYAVDKSIAAFEPLQTNSRVDIKTLQADFVQDDLPFGELAGLLMANALHYVPGKAAFIERMKQVLKPGAPWLLVEYDSDKANRWVPYPLSYASAVHVFREAGYRHITRLQNHPSVYGHVMYAALVQ